MATQADLGADGGLAGRVDHHVDPRSLRQTSCASWVMAVLPALERLVELGRVLGDGEALGRPPGDLQRALGGFDVDLGDGGDGDPRHMVDIG